VIRIDILPFLEGTGAKVRRFSRPHGFWITGSSTPLTKSDYSSSSAEAEVSPVVPSFEAVSQCPWVLLFDH